MECCGTCKFFEPFYPEWEPDDLEDRIGQCTWLPEGGLPHTWRYAPSEVLGTDYSQGTSCPQYKTIEESQ